MSIKRIGCIRSMRTAKNIKPIYIIPGQNEHYACLCHVHKMIRYISARVVQTSVFSLI